MEARRGEEEDDAAAVSTEAGHVQRRPARRAVAHIGVGAAVEQQLDDSGATSLT